MLTLRRSLRRHPWITAASVCLLIGVFLVADFKLACTRTDLRSNTKGQILTSTAEQQAGSARIQEIVLDVENDHDDELALALWSELHQKLGALPDFKEIRSPDLSGNPAFPLLRVRVEPGGAWFGLFAVGTLVVKYSYSTCSFDVEPGVDALDVRMPEPHDQNAAIVSDRIEHEVFSIGAITLPAWRHTRVEPIAGKIVEEVVAAQRQVRGLK